MTSFFVKRTEPRERSLRDANVPFETFELNDERGFLIEEQNLKAALKAMLCRITGTSASQYDGVMVASVTRGFVEDAPVPTEPLKVTVESWSYDSTKAIREKFVVVARDFVSRFKVSELVLYCNRDTSQVIPPRTDENRFNIFIYATPSENYQRISCARRLWDLSLGDDWRLWGPSNLGFVIKDPSDNPVGEMVGNNLYIFYPLSNGRFVSHGNALEIFRHILEVAATEKGLSPEERAARDRAAAESRRPQSRENYVQACDGRFRKTLEGTRASIIANRDKAEQLQTALVTCIRETRGMEQKLEQMEALEPNHVERYGAEFDKLWSLPKITEVRVEGGIVKVLTEVLYCVDPRTNVNHEIGAFRIEINPAGTIRWFNLTRRVSNANAPHVDNAGKACLGTLTEVMPELIANYEFAAIGMVAIQFIESVNIHDEWGRRISSWPVAQVQQLTEEAA